MNECEFVIVGDGRYREEFEREIAEKDVAEMFSLLGRKKAEEVPGYLAWCHVAFLSFAENDLFQMTIPAKLQSYMACGMPILAVATGESQRVIAEAECGICVAKRDARDVAEAIKQMMASDEMLHRWGKCAEQYCSARFQKEALFHELEKILNGEDVV